MIKILLALWFLFVSSAVLAMPEPSGGAGHRPCACSAQCGAHCKCCDTAASPNPCGCSGVRIQAMTSGNMLPAGSFCAFSVLQAGEPVYRCLWQEDIFHPPRALS